jgi:Bifunctional DNA primase/polymerase, N-terminal
MQPTPHYFNGGQMNIGVMLGPSSHGLTDVDLDCDQARAIAPYILPRTGAIFGRASSRAAHRLYYTDLSINADKAVLSFDDSTTGGRMLELRIGGNSGAQTVFPGSIHEEGETITWEERGEPASVNGDDLARRIHDLAAYSLIARCWPTPGLKARHNAALIVGGLLARAARNQDRRRSNRASRQRQ